MTTPIQPTAPAADPAADPAKAKAARAALDAHFAYFTPETPAPRPDAAKADAASDTGTVPYHSSA